MARAPLRVRKHGFAGRLCLRGRLAQRSQELHPLPHCRHLIWIGSVGHDSGMLRQQPHQPRGSGAAQASHQQRLNAGFKAPGHRTASAMNSGQRDWCRVVLQDRPKADLEFSVHSEHADRRVPPRIGRICRDRDNTAIGQVAKRPGECAGWIHPPAPAPRLAPEQFYPAPNPRKRIRRHRAQPREPANRHKILAHGRDRAAAFRRE